MSLSLDYFFWQIRILFSRQKCWHWRISIATCWTRILGGKNLSLQKIGTVLMQEKYLYVDHDKKLLTEKNKRKLRFHLLSCDLKYSVVAIAILFQVLSLRLKSSKQSSFNSLKCLICSCVACFGCCVSDVVPCVSKQLPTSPADQLNSCAAAGCASMLAGGVTENLTVTTNRMRRTAVSAWFVSQFLLVLSVSFI